MNFYSTRNRNVVATLKEAILQGLAPDNGLYMPAGLPQLSQEFIESLSQLSFTEIAQHLAQQLLGDDIPQLELKRMVEQAFTFDAPLVTVEPGIYALELFHGPTLAFKDFGARFMSHLLSYFAKELHREIVILAATSGDTGSAVANGFYNAPGIKVIILYPSGKVSALQEKQFTTLGGNITAVEVKGTFDDCQRMVKLAFTDKTLKEHITLSSANSINIARLIPQSFYYFYAYGKVPRKRHVVFSVPSGNFGNLTAGLMARRMGLPVWHFVAATNANDVVPEYLRTELFEPRPSIQTISNAMDVGNPSNFERLMELCSNSLDRLRGDVRGYGFTDDETRQAIGEVFKSRHYMLDPHGAVGYLGLKKYLAEDRTAGAGIFLETAHPGKFREVVEPVIGEKIALPGHLEAFIQGKKESVPMGRQYDELKAFLLERI